MPVRPIYDPGKSARPMRVAAFMSGAGTNIRRLLEYQESLRSTEEIPPFELIFIFSDRSDGGSAGEKIALEYALPYFSYDIRAFHGKKSLKRSVATEEGMEARREYDQIARRLVRAFEIDVIALGGYMSYTTLNRCINVHPGDLSIRRHDGRRKYVGENAVRDAIANGEKEIRASTILADSGIDTGPLLMVSKPMRVELPRPLEELLRDREKFRSVVERHQEQLKRVGDWRVFPRTIELIARGLFGLDEENRVYFDQRAVPNGYREEQI